MNLFTDLSSEHLQSRCIFSEATKSKHIVRELKLECAQSDFK